MKSNLEHSALPDPDEIKAYQEGKLDGARAHEIEMIAQENPLLADAIEGYSGNPAYHMLPGIAATVATVAGTTVATGAAAGTLATTVAGAVKVSAPWWHLNGWIIGTAVGTTAVVSTYYVNETIQEKKEKANHAEIILNAGDTSASAGNTIPYDPTLISAENPDNQTALSESSGEAPLDLTQGMSATDDNVLTKQKATNSRNGGADVPDKIPSVSGSALIPEGKSRDINITATSSTVAINIVKVHNYKIADYTSIRSNTWERFSVGDNGLPAQFESESEREKFRNEQPENVVPYMDYVGECIKTFDSEKYQMALDRFGVILHQYSDDVNAQFYSAMSYYHLKNPLMAIEFLTSVEKNVIRTFNEEAFFYHALCLKDLGETDGANSYFVKVVRMNGFYKERAIEEMR